MRGDLRFSRLNIVLCVLFVLGALGGCTNLPSEGPLASEITQQSKQSDYLILDVDENIVGALAQLQPYGLQGRFGRKTKRLRHDVVGTGDRLAITIWEAGNDGLFSRGEGGNSQFPAIAVNNRGYISLPYAGDIKVAGLTTRSISKSIVKRLQGQVIQPQAVVNIVKNENNAVTVSGDLAKPGRYELSLRGDRLVDVIAKAGGSKFPARETYVSVIRNGETGVALLHSIMNNPAANINVRRQDQIYLTHDPKRYTVLGAVSKPGAYVFDSTRVNVLEAVAHAGGLIDERADSTGLFVFRYENAKVLDKLGAAYPRSIKVSKSQEIVPVIYRINMRHAKSYFYAQSFMLRDKDSVFVSNSDSVQLGKFLKLLNLALTPGVTAARVGTLSGF